jgi:Reverse transcriptase (RNA-dependent DNA polymerase)
VPKPGKDPSNLSSYRPIKLLSSIIKINERVILKRLQNFITAKNVLPNQQFGFRPFGGTPVEESGQKCQRFAKLNC